MAIATSQRAFTTDRAFTAKAIADKPSTNLSPSSIAAQLPGNEPTTTRFHLIPASDWNKHHAWPPIGGLRHLIFHAASNGFDQVIRRVGRRVLIDEAAFFAWVDSNGGAK